jgi:hypothetical protein
MKFCKDCKHFAAAVHVCGGSAFNGRYITVTNTCNSEKIGTFDPVTGNRNGALADCATLRADAEKCGESAAWFEPGTLDGRLAVLADGLIAAEADGDGSECD